MSVTVNVRRVMAPYRFPADFKAGLEILFQENVDRVHSSTRVSRKPLSMKTQLYRIQKVCRSFEELRENGYALQSPYSLKHKHMQFLVELWVKNKLSGGTIENKLTYFRALAEWMGKPNLVGTLGDYVDREAHDLVRSYVATEDKSWDGNGIDPLEKFLEIAQTDPHVAMQLKLQMAFGLRVEESFLLRPVEAMGKDGMLYVTRGTKGGRPRVIPIGENASVLVEAAALVNPITKSTIPLGFTKQQWRDRFYRVLRKHGVNKANLGVTAHGLRHQRLQGMYTEVTGVEAPIKRKVERPTKELHELAMQQVVQAAGHSRPTKANAYLSTFRAQAQKKTAKIGLDQAKAAIARAGGKTAAAAELGISRQALYRILDREACSK